MTSDSGQASMACPACGHVNPQGSRFCGSCGAGLATETACPACGHANPASQAFCNQCGAPLEGAPAPTPERDSVSEPPSDSSAAGERDPRAYTPDHLAERIRSEGSALEGERKQVTVLFADVVGSMELAERTDPETWRRAMDRLFAILCEGVHRFEGTVDKFTGDGIMALFGAPIAHEDHAQRACYAALRLRDELRSYAAELRRTEGLSISVRMGINSGDVVVGTIGKDLGMEYTAVGHTVGLAQRMESIAEAGKAYLTDRSASLVKGYFDLDDLGELRVKGASEPLRVWELVGVGAARSRLDVSRARGFSLFVGRNEEMAVLEQALERGIDGDAQLVGVVGEPGVGKSRLCSEFADRCRARGITVYEAHGQAHGKSVPFLPVLELLRSYFDITELDTEQTARERIAGKLLLLDEEFSDDLPLLFDFLAVPDPERPAPRLNPEARQRQLLGAVKRLVHAQGTREPIVNVFEDLHWIDPGTETFLAEAIGALPGTRGLTIVNFRPEYRAAWMEVPYYRRIALVPLGPEAISQLLGDLLGSDPSLDGLPELIRERTGGNPFFVEEVVQELVESGALAGTRGAFKLAQPIDEVAVPPSVQAVLAARIDRLAEREKSVLQAAAVIGKEFTQPVLARALELPPDELEEALRGLVGAELVFEEALYPEPEYAFKHPLTQEVAYGSQLIERRARTHAAVARAIEERYPEQLDEQAALVARHWEEAGETLTAARWHARAAGWAGFNDPAESLRHWNRTRELAHSAADEPDAEELSIASRASILQLAWRLGIPEQEADVLFAEAKALAERRGDRGSLAVVAGTYATLKGLRGETNEQVEYSLEALRLAEEADAPGLVMAVRGTTVYSLFLAGRYREAVEHATRGIELGEQDPNLGAGIAVANPYAFCVGIRGFVRTILGELNGAREDLERALRLGREHGDTETVGWTHQWSVNLARTVGDEEGGLAHGRQTVDIAERLGDSFSRAWAHSLLGVAHTNRKQWREAAEELEWAFELARERETALEGQAWRLGYLAVARAELGDGERTSALAKQAIQAGHDAEARGNMNGALGALHRGGLALLIAGGPERADEVAPALERALNVARDTGARGEEPLIRMSLAELAGARGDRTEREHQLREAQRIFEETGATGHLERLEAARGVAAS